MDIGTISVILLFGMLALLAIGMPLGFASVGLRYICYAIWPATRPELPEFAE